MTLPDTSVWIDYYRSGDAELAHLLLRNEALCHPFVIGELSLGYLRPRELVLARLQQLPKAEVADDAEVLAFIEAHSLFGFGIGYVDVHLLLSAALTEGTLLWTRDRRLRKAAEKLELHAVDLR